VIFDHPNRHGISAKDIERARRDRNCDDEHFEAITGESNLSGNWRSFLSNRENTRKLVNFLSHHFLHLASGLVFIMNIPSSMVAVNSVGTCGKFEIKASPYQDFKILVALDFLPFSGIPEVSQIALVRNKHWQNSLSSIYTE
jgi:hypothetical protein